MRLLLLTLALPGIPALAQWTDDVLVNTSVRSGNGVDAATPLMSDGPDGSTYVSWFDSQPGGYQLRMQRLDATGYPLWAEEGLLVSDHPQNSALFRYDLKTDNEGNGIVAFQDERSGQLDIVVYKVGPDGSQLWGADGVPLTDPASTQGLSPVIGVLGSNEVVIAWNASDATDKWVAAYHLLEDGSVPFQDPNQITGPNKYSRPKVIAFANNDYFIQYVEEVGNFPFICTMYAQRFDGEDNVIGTSIVSTKVISVFYFPEPVSDGYGGFYLAFTTGNTDNPALSDVYVQHMDVSGSIWSATGVEAAVGTATQKFTRGCVLLPGDLGVMVPLQVTNTSQSQGGISVQRVDPAGVVQLGTGGMEVLPLSADLPTPDDAAATSDGAIMVYSSGGFGNEHISAMRLGADGFTVWTPLSAVLCSANSNKDDVSCGSVVNDQLVTVWQDDRQGSGIYAQNLLGDGEVGPVGICDCAPPPGLTLLQDMHRAVLRVGDVNGAARVEVFNMEGRSVWQRVLGELLGPTQVDLPQETVGQGVYVLRFIDGQRVRSLRWMAW